MKIIIFVGLFAFSTNYLIPKGILALMNWKKEGKVKELRTCVSCFVAGFFGLAYLFYIFIFTKWV